MPIDFGKGLHHTALVGFAVGLQTQVIRTHVDFEPFTGVKRPGVHRRQDRHFGEQRFAAFGKVPVANWPRLLDVVSGLTEFENPIPLLADLAFRQPLDDIVVGHDGREHIVTLPAAFDIPIDEIARFCSLLGGRIDTFRPCRAPVRVAVPKQIVQKVGGTKRKSRIGGALQKPPPGQSVGVNQRFGQVGIERRHSHIGTVREFDIGQILVVIHHCFCFPHPKPGYSPKR